MKKHITKFIAAFVLIVVSATMVAMGTYAWFVLSTDPTAKGMKVSVGSAENITILIAPDMTKDVEGATVHYPGKFGKSLSLAETLEGAAALSPVSTADGVNWYGPVYADLSDGGDMTGYRLLAGEGFVAAGGKTYTPVYDLSGVPVGAAEVGEEREQGYICLDFWVVSPEEDYELRVSTNTRHDNFDAGSFVLAVPAVTAETVEGQEILTASAARTPAEAGMRLGFQVDTTEDPAAKTAYDASTGANHEYKTLRGAFADPTKYTFTIYEPNADLHPGGAAENGVYAVTKPWSPGGEAATVEGFSIPGIMKTDVLGRLTVQGTSAWAADETDTDKLLLDRELAKLTEAEKTQPGFDPMSCVFDTKLSGQLAGYVASGAFVRDASGLTEGSALSADKGAADLPVIVTLTKDQPQRIRLYLWLEGEDIDCTNAATGHELVINIELAGATLTNGGSNP